MDRLFDSEPGAPMTHHEIVMRWALGSEWRRCNDPELWVPTGVLYDHYVRRWASRPHAAGEEDSGLLPATTFGSILPSLIPGIYPVRRRHPKTGSITRGWGMLTGPGEVRGRPPGRPRARSKD